MHILYVEDDRKLQVQTTKFLRSYHHRVTTFTNSLDALNFATSEAFDLLLCDQKLEHSPSGLTLAAQIRNLYPDRPITMISSYATLEEMSQGYEIDVDAFLHRPISLPDLLSKLYQAVERRQAKFPLVTDKLDHGALEIDIAERTATWHGELLHLTPSEFTLLAKLTSKPGQVFSVTDLCAVTKGVRLNAQSAKDMLKQHIFGLRSKLAQGGKYAQPIENVRGQGYRIVLTET